MSEMKIELDPELSAEAEQPAEVAEEVTDSTESTTPEAASVADATDATGASSEQNDSDAPEEEPETFPKAYVDKLRDEAAQGRTKAKRYDDRATRLHTALIAATGKLADPTDLPFDEAHLDDQEALEAAIEELLTAKPHLASRTPRGDIGQGTTGTAGDDFSLSGWLGGITR